MGAKSLESWDPMSRIKPPTGPWQDMMGPLPTGESSLVVVDYYSRFYEVEIMRSRYGFPFTLKSDNGPQFCCEEFEKFLSDHGIEPHDFSIAAAAGQWSCRKTEPNSAQVFESCSC